MTAVPVPVVERPSPDELAGKGATEAPPGPKPSLLIAFNDNMLVPEAHRQVREFLDSPGWKFGWKSRAKKDAFSFWHKHFAGPIHSGHRFPDTLEDEEGKLPVDREAELHQKAPLLHAMWQGLRATVFKQHRLVRCCANAFSFGCEGTLHVDDREPNGYTAIYYPNDRCAAPACSTASMARRASGAMSSRLLAATSSAT
jgi:hypothetical protein